MPSWEPWRGPAGDVFLGERARKLAFSGLGRKCCALLPRRHFGEAIFTQNGGDGGSEESVLRRFCGIGSVSGRDAATDPRARGPRKPGEPADRAGDAPGAGRGACLVGEDGATDGFLCRSRWFATSNVQAVTETAFSGPHPMLLKRKVSVVYKQLRTLNSKTCMELPFYDASSLPET